MLFDLFQRLNWVDLVVIIAFVRICYVSFKTGFTIELFKLLGVLFASYISIHYFTAFSDILIRRGASTEKVPLEFTDFISFLLLVIAGYLVFVFLRSVFYRFIKMEAAPNLQKWGGLVLGIFRAFLTIGLVIFMLVISSFSYTKNSVKSSYMGESSFKIAPATYSWIWNNIVSKFMYNEKFNKTVFEIKEDFAQK
jgi:uncharacterized membrane protein required for colicin V production